MMSSMRDVANLAQVSVGTVWNYLHNSHLIGDYNLHKIQTAIKDLDFKFNPDLIRRNQKFKTIGVVVPDLTNLFYLEAIQSLRDRLDEFGFSLALFDSKWNTQKELSHLVFLGTQNIVGIVVAPCGDIPNELKKFSDKGIAVGIMGVKPDSLDYFSVSTNDFAGGSKGIDFLADAGHSSIAWITKADPVPKQLAERELGAFFAAAKRNITLTKVTAENMSSSDGFKATEVILGLPFPITAIFCCNDLLGLGALQFLSKIDLKNSININVLGYDNLEILDITSSKLNSVAQKPRDIGLLLADLFLELKMSDSPIGCTNYNIVLEPEVISRTKIDSNKLIIDFS